MKKLTKRIHSLLMNDSLLEYKYWIPILLLFSDGNQVDSLVHKPAKPPKDTCDSRKLLVAVIC